MAVPGEGRAPEGAGGLADGAVSAGVVHGDAHADLGLAVAREAGADGAQHLRVAQLAAVLPVVDADRRQDVHLQQKGPSIMHWPCLMLSPLRGVPSASRQSAA